jgi:hypothetical protein
MGVSIEAICIGIGLRRSAGIGTLFDTRHMVSISIKLIGISIGIELIGVGIGVRAFLGTRLVAEQDGEEVTHDLLRALRDQIRLVQGETHLHHAHEGVECDDAQVL